MAKVLSGIDKCEDFSSTWSRTGWNGDCQCEMKPKVKESIEILFWEIIGGCTVNFPRRVSNFKKLVAHLGAASSGVKRTRPRIEPIRKRSYKSRKRNTKLKSFSIIWTERVDHTISTSVGDAKLYKNRCRNYTKPRNNGADFFRATCNSKWLTILFQGSKSSGNFCLQAKLHLFRWEILD